MIYISLAISLRKALLGLYPLIFVVLGDLSHRFIKIEREMTSFTLEIKWLLSAVNFPQSRVSVCSSSFFLFPVRLTMPPKSKRHKTLGINLEKAREAKKVCLSDVGESSSTVHNEETLREERAEPERLVDLL